MQRRDRSAGEQRAGGGIWRRLRPSDALFAFAVLLVTVVAATATWVILQARETRLAEGEREVASLALVLAEQTERTFQSVDFLLLAVIEELRSGAVIDNPAAIEAILKARTANAPQLWTLGCVDRNGILRQDARSGGPLAIDVTDRSLFAAVRDGREHDLVIDQLTQGRVNGKTFIPVVRRLPGGDGRFAGAVVAALDPEYFKRLYKALDPSERLLIGLVKNDGSRLVRHPEPSGVMGQSIPPDAPVMRHLGEAPSGTFRDVTVIDGKRRIFAYKRLDAFPIHVVVAITEATVLAEWRWEAIETAVAAVVLAGLLCALIALLARQVRRRETLSEALRASETRFRDFAQSTSDWFWEQDDQFRFTYLSGELEQVTGVSIGSFVGKTREEVSSSIKPEDLEAHLADLAAHRPFRDFRSQRVRADGEVRYLSISGKPIFDGAGRFCGYRGAGRDITQEILAERRLLEAKAEAEAASVAKGEFLAIISHELRTPLNAIIGFSEVIAREVFGPIGRTKYREYAVDILSAGQHLLKLINNILDMSKLEARRMNLDEAPFDLAAVIDACLRLMHRRAAETGVSLVNGVAPGLPWLNGDETRIRQAILNLVANAVKFTPPGGEVKLTAELTPEALDIVVSDTGIGMTADEILIALQPFRQVESSMNRIHEGTGLGLPLAKAFIELHGGRLIIESTPGHGTRARIHLPAGRLVRPAVAAD